jgi:hypothetical protein
LCGNRPCSQQNSCRHQPRNSPSPPHRVTASTSRSSRICRESRSHTSYRFRPAAHASNSGSFRSLLHDFDLCVFSQLFVQVGTKLVLSGLR